MQITGRSEAIMARRTAGNEGWNGGLGALAAALFSRL
jgi:hypothetical protein